MSNRKKILIIVGSVREGRTADKILKLIKEDLSKKNVSLSIIDPTLKEFRLPFYNENKPPMYANGAYDSVAGQLVDTMIQDTDGILLLSPEYNHGVPAVLKNIIDWSYRGWENKPVGIISYGVDSGNYARSHLKDIIEVLGGSIVHLRVGIKLAELEPSEIDGVNTKIQAVTSSIIDMITRRENDVDGQA